MIAVVLGMHRAGTSMLSSLVQALGVNMGERTLWAREVPGGELVNHYEDSDFLDLHKRILGRAGGSWHAPPPEAFLLPLEDMALALGRTRAEVTGALELLLELAFIDAPGAYHGDAWIFRKLTRRGVELAERVRDPREWEKVKEAYGDLLER